MQQNIYYLPFSTKANSNMTFLYSESHDKDYKRFKINSYRHNILDRLRRQQPLDDITKDNYVVRFNDDIEISIFEKQPDYDDMDLSD